MHAVWNWPVGQTPPQTEMQRCFSDSVTRRARKGTLWIAEKSRKTRKLEGTCEVFSCSHVPMFSVFEDQLANRPDSPPSGAAGGIRFSPDGDGKVNVGAGDAEKNEVSWSDIKD